LSENEKKLSIDDYLAKMAGFVGNEYGKTIRQHFMDEAGSSELAMLQTPSKDEFEQLKRAVAIMTLSEKEHAEQLSDEQVLKIAEDANIDPGIFAIFINGYVLECKRVL
jgi:hypothetical protein